MQCISFRAAKQMPSVQARRRGQAAHFEVADAALGDLAAVTVGLYAGPSDGDPSWGLDSVLIEAPDGQQWACPCHGAKLSGGEGSTRQRVLVAARCSDRGKDADDAAAPTAAAQPVLLPHVALPSATAPVHDALAPRTLRDAGAQTLQDAAPSQRAMAHYEVKVHTPALGGTSAQVAVQLCGSSGEAVGPLRLGGVGGAGAAESATRERTIRPTLSTATGRNATSPMCQAGTAVFEFEAADVGTLKHLRVGHDGGGDSPSWHLNTVVVNVTPVPQDRCDPIVKLCTHVPASQWPASSLASPAFSLAIDEAQHYLTHRQLQPLVEVIPWAYLYELTQQPCFGPKRYAPTPLPACVARANTGASDAKAVPQAQEYVFECGEVLDSETGMERVLAPSEHRRAVWDAEEVASAVPEAVQASATLPPASVPPQQQQQPPSRDAASPPPESAYAAALPGLQQADGPLHESSASATAAAQGSAPDGPPPAPSPVEASAPVAAPAPMPRSVPQVMLMRSNAPPCVCWTAAQKHLGARRCCSGRAAPRSQAMKS